MLAKFFAQFDRRDGYWVFFRYGGQPVLRFDGHRWEYKNVDDNWIDEFEDEDGFAYLARPVRLWLK